MTPLILVLVGPPGSGKGTQSKVLTKRLGIPAISTGEMFRAECDGNTELGGRIRAILSAGGLVGDEIVNSMVAARVGSRDCERGCLLDGYPRTVTQAREFSAFLKHRGLPKPAVLKMAAEDDEIVRRLSGRLQCSRCNLVYNLNSMPPRSAGRCDHDGCELVGREDDQEPVIRRRLSFYREQTEPVLAYYGAASIHEVDAGRPPEEVAHTIEHVVTALLRNGSPAPFPAADGSSSRVFTER